MKVTPRFWASLLLASLLLGWGRAPADAQVKAIISGDTYYVAEHTGNPDEDYAAVFFDGAQSTGDIVSYTWTPIGWYEQYVPDQPWFDGTVQGSSSYYFPYVEWYGIGLYVEDSDGNSDYTEMYFQVEFRNELPVVNAGPDQWFFAPHGLNVTLHGSAYDPDGDQMKNPYWWKDGDLADHFGDGYVWDQTGFLFPGVHDIVLQVQDPYSHNEYLVGVDHVIITVYGSWIDSLSTTSSFAQEFPPTITVTGQAFRKGAVITWNEQALPTTWLSPTQLRTRLTPDQIALAGVFQIRVNNPDWENGAPGGFSNTVDFMVLNRAPAIFSLNPSSVVHGSPTFSLAVTGARFVAGSVASWNGSPRPTVVNSPTSLIMTIYDTDVAAIGRAAVTVSNPAPGGGTSPVKMFAIK
jgi:hypothetical protein